MCGKRICIKGDQPRSDDRNRLLRFDRDGQPRLNLDCIDDAISGPAHEFEEFNLFLRQDEIVPGFALNALRAELGELDLPAIIGPDDASVPDGKMFQASVVDGLHQRQDASLFRGQS